MIMRIICIICMHAAALARTFSHCVVFVAGGDRQYDLPFGTPKEVETYRIQLANLIGRRNGGYIGGGKLGASRAVGQGRGHALHLLDK
jgi:hypothetical protein